MSNRTVTTVNDRDERGRFISRNCDSPMSWDLQRALIDADAERLRTSIHHRIAAAHVLLSAVASGAYGLHPDAAAILADQDGGS